MCLNYAGVSLHTVLAPLEQQRSLLFQYVRDEDEDAAAGSAFRQILQGLRAHLTLHSAKAVIPEMANPLKPTARTRKEMATARVWENPTTRSSVASIPKPAVKHAQLFFLKLLSSIRQCKNENLYPASGHVTSVEKMLYCFANITQDLITESFWNNHASEKALRVFRY